MHRRLAVPMLPLRVWVHCPRASNGLLPPRSNLVGHVRWYARSDSVLLFLLQTIIPTAFRSQVGNPYLGIASGLPITRPCCAGLLLPSFNVHADENEPQGQRYFCNTRWQHYVEKEMSSNCRCNIMAVGTGRAAPQHCDPHLL